MVSTPWTGFFDFYVKKILRAILALGVNALNGLLWFLLENEKVVEQGELMCQRPERASLISTTNMY